jgi:hypothetical protein
MYMASSKARGSSMATNAQLYPAMWERLQGGPGGHQGAHGGHHAVLQDGVCDLGEDRCRAGRSRSSGQVLAEELDVPIDGLGPGFASSFVLEPAGVAGLTAMNLR